MKFSPAEKYDAKTFAQALLAWVEEEEEYAELYEDEDEQRYYMEFAEKYREMAQWFKDIPVEFRDCEFELVECGSLNFGDPLVDVYRDGEYICSLQFSSGEPQVLNFLR